MKVAVVGAGWAGLAAAVRAADAGHHVTLFETAAQPGGRARTVVVDGEPLDNGQHILIGAYTGTLALLGEVGVDLDAAFDRRPLELRDPDGNGLRMPARVPAWLAFPLAVAGAQGWGWRDRAALLAAASRWARDGFRCAPALTVGELAAGLPSRVRERFIDPLCVAALNTPAADASAAVLLRVLHDALWNGRGSADLLLPRVPLGELLPAAAMRRLRAAGAELRLGCRVERLAPDADGGWRITSRDGDSASAVVDAVVLACTANEAARLAAPHAPAWAQAASALRHEPIVTVYLRCPGARLPSPMTALVDGPDAPAQFAFDLGAIGRCQPGVFAFAISGAARWVAAGSQATADAVLRQAQRQWPAGTWPQPPTVWRVLADKRATFRCTPGLLRPPAATGVARLWAAGDYLDGPYPATIEGAVRSGVEAARLLGRPSGQRLRDPLLLPEPPRKTEG